MKASAPCGSNTIFVEPPLRTATFSFQMSLDFSGCEPTSMKGRTSSSETSRETDRHVHRVHIADAGGGANATAGVRRWLAVPSAAAPRNWWTSPSRRRSLRGKKVRRSRPEATENAIYLPEWRRDVRVPLAIKVLQCPCFTDQTGTKQYRRIYNDL